MKPPEASPAPLGAADTCWGRAAPVVLWENPPGLFVSAAVPSCTGSLSSSPAPRTQRRRAGRYADRLVSFRRVCFCRWGSGGRWMPPRGFTAAGSDPPWWWTQSFSLISERQTVCQWFSSRSPRPRCNWLSWSMLTSCRGKPMKTNLSSHVVFRVTVTETKLSDPWWHILIQNWDFKDSPAPRRRTLWSSFSVWAEHLSGFKPVLTAPVLSVCSTRLSWCPTVFNS